MSDFIQKIEKIEALIDEGKLDEAKEAIDYLMGSVNTDLSSILQNVRS